MKSFLIVLTSIIFIISGCANFSSDKLISETTEVVCDNRYLILNDASEREKLAAELVCKISEGLSTPTVVPVIEQCIILDKVLKTEKFQNDYNKVCNPILDEDTETALRAATVAFTALKNKDLDFEPPLVTFNQKKNLTECGHVSFNAACQNTIYLFPERWDTFEWRIADFFNARKVAIVYVVWHEIAHTYQFQKGLLVNYGSSNDVTRALELQADCLTGYIAKFFDASLDQLKTGGEFARSIGGRPNGTHGTNEERFANAKRGYEKGFESCLT